MIPQEYSHDVRKVMKWSFVLLIILSVFLAVQTLSALKEYGTIGKGIYPNKTLSVSGEGEVLATPDVAQFTFTVTEEADSIAAAQNTVTEKINTALEALQSLGVEEKDIKTTGYNAYPRYTYPEVLCVSGACPRGDRVLSGYEVSQTLSVKVRDTAKAGEALSQVANAGVSNVSGLNFVIDDQDILLAEARSEAIADAEEKIEKLAQDLNVKVKGVVSFYEDMGNYYPYAEERAVSSTGFGGDAMTTLVAPQLPAGENTVRVRVNVTYEIK